MLAKFLGKKMLDNLIVMSTYIWLYTDMLNLMHNPATTNLLKSRRHAVFQVALTGDYAGTITTAGGCGFGYGVLAMCVDWYFGVISTRCESSKF